MSYKLQLLLSCTSINFELVLILMRVFARDGFSYFCLGGGGGINIWGVLMLALAGPGKAKEKV